MIKELLEKNTWNVVGEKIPNATSEIFSAYCGRKKEVVVEITITNVLQHTSGK